jgi:hypothetical protein
VLRPESYPQGQRHTWLYKVKICHIHQNEKHFMRKPIPSPKFKVNIRGQTSTMVCNSADNYANFCIMHFFITIISSLKRIHFLSTPRCRSNLGTLFCFKLLCNNWFCKRFLSSFPSLCTWGSKIFLSWWTPCDNDKLCNITVQKEVVNGSLWSIVKLISTHFFLFRI